MLFGLLSLFKSCLSSWNVDSFRIPCPCVLGCHQFTTLLSAFDYYLHYSRATASKLEPPHWGQLVSDIALAGHFIGIHAIFLASVNAFIALLALPVAQRHRYLGCAIASSLSFIAWPLKYPARDRLESINTKFMIYPCLLLFTYPVFDHVVPRSPILRLT